MHTIAAIATASGRSDRAIVRLSGPRVSEILGRVLRSEPPSRPGPHTACFHLPAASRGFSDPLPLPIALLIARAPRSYTGEDTAELVIPGNPPLAERVLNALLDAGATRAEPGAFSARAYLAGKLSLEQAEGIASLIAADRDEDMAAARAVLEGITGQRYANWLDRGAHLLALVEAGVDFTDQEDVVPIAPADLRAQLAMILDEIEAHLGPDAATEADRTAPVVVLAGPPNAGKSTLFNALLGHQRSVVSDTAGTTRDAIEEPLDLSADAAGAGEITLVDLAGIGDRATDPLDAEAQRRARAHVESADLVVACDPEGRFTNAPTDTPVLRVNTKADQAHGALAGADVAVCALDGWQVDALRRAIADATTRAGGASRAVVVPRHRRALREAAAGLERAIAAVDPGARALDMPELVAGELRTALDALGSICGRVTPDDVIGRVFAAFCVGK